MAISRAKLILHPVRMRVLVALARRQLTARQVGELLPDVPRATLYAHLGTLTKAGLLRVVAERQVRGAVEKVYTAVEEYAQLNPVDFARATPEEHLQYFTIFAASLIGEFARYLERGEPINLVADGVGYRQTPLYLSDEEFMAAALDVNRALLPYLANQRAPNRRRRLYTTIVFPDAEPAEERGEGGAASAAPGG